MLILEFLGSIEYIDNDNRLIFFIMWIKKLSYYVFKVSRVTVPATFSYFK